MSLLQRLRHWLTRDPNDHSDSTLNLVKRLGAIAGAFLAVAGAIALVAGWVFGGLDLIGGGGEASPSTPPSSSVADARSLAVVPSHEPTDATPSPTASATTASTTTTSTTTTSTSTTTTTVAPALSVSVGDVWSSDLLLVGYDESDLDEFETHYLAVGFADYRAGLPDDARQRVIDVGFLGRELTLQATGDDAVAILDVRVAAVERSPIPAGLHIGERPECGGPILPIVVEAHLEDDPVSYDAYRETESGGREPLADGWRISVSRTDIEIVELHAFVSDVLASFVIEIEYSSGGDREVLTIDDDGVPFQVAGVTADNPRYTPGVDFPPYAAGDGLERTPLLDGAIGGCAPAPDGIPRDEDVACALVASGRIETSYFLCGG